VADAKIPDELEDLTVPIDSVARYPQNPRDGDVGAIAVSLEENGQFRPIVVNRRDHLILAGNHTWQAAKLLGWDRIAATSIDVDDATARRIVLVDNRANDLASYDNDLLTDLLTDVVQDEGLEGLLGTGFDAEDLDDLLEEISAQGGPFDDDEPSEKKLEAVIRFPTLKDQVAFFKLIRRPVAGEVWWPDEGSRHDG